MSTPILTAADQTTLDELSADAATDPGVATIAANWLMEREIPIGEVILCYRGTPAGFLDGLHRAVFAEWLRWTEPDYVASSISWTEPGAVPKHDLRPRWEKVRDMKGDPQVVADAVANDPDVNRRAIDFAANVMFDGHAEMPGAPPDLVERCKGVIIRDLKRRVLALFPEVVWYGKEARIHLEEVEVAGHWLNHNRPHSEEWLPMGRPDSLGHMTLLSALKEAGLAPDQSMRARYDAKSKLLVYQQMTAAPNLIPPEPRPERGDAFCAECGGDVTRQVAMRNQRQAGCPQCGSFAIATAPTLRGEHYCAACGHDVSQLIDHRRQRYGGCPWCLSFDTLTAAEMARLGRRRDPAGNAFR